MEMEYVEVKKNRTPVKINDLNCGDIVSLKVGKLTPNIQEKEVYCRVNRLRVKNDNIYGIEVTHLNRILVPEGYAFFESETQPAKNNNPQITKDCRKYGYNRVNFNLYY